MRPTAVAVLANIIVCASRVAAETEPVELPTLAVKHSAEVTDCPTAPDLARAIEQENGSPRVRVSRSTPPIFTVYFSKQGATYSATIQVGGGITGERRVEDVADNCSALVDAVAITVSLLADEMARAPSRVDRSRSVPPRTTGTFHSSVSLRASGETLGGVVRPLAPGVAVGANYRWARWWSAEIGVHWLPSQTFFFGPGVAHVSFAMISADVCVAPIAYSRVRLDICAGMAGGLLWASTENFTTDDSATRPWWALETKIQSHVQLFGPLGLVFGTGPLLPLKSQNFSIIGTSERVIYSSPPLAWLAEAGLFLTIK